MRLGDLDALKKTLEPIAKQMNDSLYGDGIYRALKEIDNAPTVEPPQGEWNYIQADMCVCPFCGAMPHKLYKNYCAKCGAELKGGTE